ncbi:hypothetical protein VOLCADRAFT_102810 [Volvox carteri f. nagariensis]|uniref:Uncharacterized protein n=1 Tax=Volvox carteri f. nagariensis TaxID=3068 RepID=D8TIA6_VOLCA|nr:uncharacterized protein VOLCADRAFT_102810 [Volvox carteri f. nagariensis]EFJ52857.1 hypothetical protein VOLCADRAFT_102810 [Volvox carteri f. nagariensis]|eukprot:XP_002945862.1 hypothetical protein VOLCADRAFT_102810 [Volvox carteri f. nagariensis]
MADTSTAPNQGQSQESKDNKPREYTYAKKKYSIQAYYEKLQEVKRRNCADWWKFFLVLLLENEVRIECTLLDERNWSLWGNLFHKARNRLGQMRAMKLIFIRQNDSYAAKRNALSDEEVVMQLLAGDEEE